MPKCDFNKRNNCQIAARSLQDEQWKHHLQNLFQFNNKDTRTTSTCSTISIDVFEDSVSSYLYSVKVIHIQSHLICVQSDLIYI